jgi:hypothetical protein
LLSVRREHIAPRLAGMNGRAGRFETVSDRALTVSWKLGDGSTLAARLNLSDRAERAPAKPEGELLHCEPASARAAFDAGELPANSAAFYLRR